MFYNDHKDGFVIRDGHTVLLDDDGNVIDDRSAYTGVSYVGRKF